MAPLSTDCIAQMQLVALAGHESHPSFGRLVMLVFEAVMEVVCVSLPGYIIASLGYFDADKQKFLANLNVMLFTPCLIFTKLASQLDGEKFLDLAVIPILFVVMTLVSYLESVITAKLFRFNRRASNFVIAMGVFGNSNSLPISLVLSLSQTLKGLHWSKIPGDNDDEVGARGILYLMIFQQLGQALRWSWGYHVLLAPKSTYNEYRQDVAEEGRYRDNVEDLANQPEVLAEDTTMQLTSDVIAEPGDGMNDARGDSDNTLSHSPTTECSDVFEPNGHTPVAPRSRASPYVSDSEEHASRGQRTPHKRNTAAPSTHEASSSPRFLDPEYDPGEDSGIMSFPRICNSSEDEILPNIARLKLRFLLIRQKCHSWAASKGHKVFTALPRPLQMTLIAIWGLASRFLVGLWEFMNPPLWAMLLAVVVASIPSLKAMFFEEGTFISNSVTRAVSQSAGVAVPLILVVLGANLSRNTQTHETHDSEETQIGTRLLVACLVCRIVLPTLIMAPILALFAKYVPVSILGDPIFVVVCFLLTGAPSALQLAQICQINGVFERTMSKILFQSYVIWIMPSTLILVMCALEVVEWTAV